MCVRERVAQSVEHMTFNHGVLGSSPSALTKEIKCLGKISKARRRLKKRFGHTFGHNKKRTHALVLRRVRSAANCKRKCTSPDAAHHGHQGAPRRAHRSPMASTRTAPELRLNFQYIALNSPACLTSSHGAARGVGGLWAFVEFVQLMTIAQRNTLCSLFGKQAAPG